MMEDMCLNYLIYTLESEDVELLEHFTDGHIITIIYNNNKKITVDVWTMLAYVYAIPKITPVFGNN